MDAVNSASLRGICSTYFENNVTPILKYIQQSQEQLNIQLTDLRASLDRKANTADVPRLDQLAELAAAQATHSSTKSDDVGGVSTRVQLKELASRMERKADASSVPTMAQYNKLAALVEQKLGGGTKDSVGGIEARLAEVAAASEKRAEELAASLRGKADACSVPTLAQHNQLAAAVEQKAGGVAPEGPVGNYEMARLQARLAEMVTAVERKAGADETERQLTELRELQRVAEGKVAALAQQMADKPAGGAIAGSGSDSGAVDAKAEVKKVHVVVAAAASRFDKQLRQLRLQMSELKDQLQKGISLDSEQPGGAVGERWPGRVLAHENSPHASEAGSDVASLMGSTFAASECSVAGLSPDERAELRKIRTIVGAAGTAFSKDLRAVRGQLRELRGEVAALKKGHVEEWHSP